MALGLSRRVKEIAPSPTLAIDAKTKELIAKGEDIVNLSVGEPDFPTPKGASDAAIAAIEAGFTKYTAPAGTVELRQAIAAKLQAENGLTYSADEIIVSSGAKHSLYNAFIAVVDEGDEVILQAPYWVSYPEMIRLAGGVPVIIQTDESTGFKMTPDMLAAAITAKTKAVLLNSPSNPTGAVYHPHELEALAEVIAKHAIYIISDEIYEKMVYGPEHVSIASFSQTLKDRTILVNGFSKAFSMTGWRVGYIAADKQLVKAMTSFQSQTTSNAASISQKAAEAALDHFEPSNIEMFRKRRDYVIRRIQNMPSIHCEVPEGAFYVFPNISELFGKSYQGKVIDSSDTFAAVALEQANISIVPGSGFGAPNNFRISYATSQQNLEKAMDRLENFLRECR
ncbi:MAG: aspartate aminotransferase [Bacilli bacterium]|nr:aspartate aminotransferase [Bacilli bacterium]